jgi:nucleoid-associated protein YgaU
MKRHLRSFAPAALLLASCLHLGAQSEPAALHVTPVPANPQPEPVTVQPRIAAPTTPPVAAPTVVDESKARIAKLEADLAKAKSDLAKAQNELLTAKANSAAGSGRLRLDLDKVSAEREALAEQVAGLTADKERAESQRDQVRVDLASARARLEVYEKTLREDATPDDASLREALRESQSRVDMTVRAFELIEQENNRIKAQLGSMSPQTFKADVASTERELRQAQHDLVAERIRSANLARELARARPGTPLVIDESQPVLSSPAAPTRPSAVAETQPDPATPDAEAKIHVVADGETLSGIAKLHYGSASRWTEIYNANRDVMRNENHLVPGMKLRIP